ncbi:MAG: hypothetical protein ACTS6G_04400 [Candidatus Hodgkinia cicadicola]
MNRRTEPNSPLTLRNASAAAPLTSFERSPEAVLAASKAAIAKLCKVSPSTLTFGLSVRALFQSLILSILSKGDEVILCDHKSSPAVVSQVFASSALPIPVKGKTFQTRTINVLNAANSKTKLVYMQIPSTSRSFNILQHFRNRLPSHITLVLNFNSSNFPSLRLNNLPGNIIVLRTFPPCFPPLNFVWMHAKSFRISSPSKLINPFTIHKVSKTMMVNAINDFRHWTIQTSAALFWGTKLASQIRSNQLILRNVQPNSVTMQLIKRFPANLVHQWFKAFGVQINITAASAIFNAINFRLSSATSNSRSAKSLFSIKTMSAVVKTVCCHHPFRPSPAFWTKTPPNSILQN